LKVDILAFGAHPDDIELSCSGILLSHASQGKTFGLVDLTEGELGTRGSPEIRKVEANKAAEILGASFRHNLGLADGFFQIDELSLKKVIYHIRKYKPELVLCNAPTDRHPDHGKGHELVKQACFLSGLTKITTKDMHHSQEAWRPKMVFGYIQFYALSPDIIVDISSFMDKKLESIKAYNSQFYNPNSKEPETVISSRKFLENISERSSDWGRLIGTEYGEGLMYTRVPGIQNLFNLL